MEKTYFIFTLGCQMNVSDSQKIAAKLERMGFKPTTEKNSPLIIVNSCSVRQKAVDRIWGKVNQWQKAKKKIWLTGCLLPTDRKKFAQKGIGYKNFYDDDFLKIVPKKTSVTAYLPIMTGCDNFCSYCAVPYTRGREKSRPLKDVLAEVKQAIRDGYQEILLLGQNVNSYQHGLAKLLKKIDRLPGDFKFNFISSNPHDMTAEIIQTLAELKKWPRELHLPLQSGDDEILHKMNRKYTSQQYLDLIEKIRSKIKNLTLTTDIIVGFPGESQKQFENTVKFCKKIKFDKAYIAQYSPRPGTAAAKLKDNLTQKEKKRRWLKLEHLING